MRGALSIPPALGPIAGVLDSQLALVERAFDDQLRSDLPPVQGLVEHVARYRGKMLRPTLCITCALAADPDSTAPPAHVPALGAVCEMVHMATLVHDDVLDEADTRRRGATVNQLQGNEAAVILGDYLIASSFHLCATLPDPRYAVRVGQASADLCAGELLQLHHRNDFSLDEATYFEILRKKTGELIAVSCELGALAAGAAPDVQRAAAGFGMTLGVAFQIQDDLLDLAGDADVVGKSVRKDLEKGKLTLPLIHHLAAATPAQRGRTLALLERVRAAGHTPLAEFSAELLDALDRTGSASHARRVAASLVAEAADYLAALAPSPARDLLGLMAQAVVARAF